MPSAASSHLTRENPYVMNTIQVEVVSAEESIFSGEAEFVVLPGEVGELGVYPNHTPLITRIKAGAVRIRVPGENRDELIFVAGGILEIQPNLVTVLADTAIRGNDLDEARANEARRAAEEALTNAKSKMDLARAHSELAAVTAQIQTIRRYRSR
jgi:ATP synthase F1, epsilon subunit